MYQWLNLSCRLSHVLPGTLGRNWYHMMSHRAGSASDLHQIYFPGLESDQIWTWFLYFFLVLWLLVWDSYDEIAHVRNNWNKQGILPQHVPYHNITNSGKIHNLSDKISWRCTHPKAMATVLAVWLIWTWSSHLLIILTMNV